MLKGRGAAKGAKHGAVLAVQGDFVRVKAHRVQLAKAGAAALHALPRNKLLVTDGLASADRKGLAATRI